MITLDKALSAWSTPAFNETFKYEVGLLEEVQLPLQQSLAQGSHASTRNMKVMVNSVSETNTMVIVKAGIFYTGILPGCACSDDVAPESEFPEYCDLLFSIDKQTAETNIELLAD